MIRVPGLTERQCSTLVRDGDCIVRTTSINRVTGYSTVWFQGRTEYAHRVVALAAFGPPPFPGAVIDHFVCRRRDCVNPEHLRFVTNRENVLAGVGPSAEHARQTPLRARPRVHPGEHGVRAAEAVGCPAPTVPDVRPPEAASPGQGPGRRPPSGACGVRAHSP